MRCIPYTSTIAQDLSVLRHILLHYVNKVPKFPFYTFCACCNTLIISLESIVDYHPPGMCFSSPNHIDALFSDIDHLTSIAVKPIRLSISICRVDNINGPYSSILFCSGDTMIETSVVPRLRSAFIRNRPRFFEKLIGKVVYANERSDLLQKALNLHQRSLSSSFRISSINLLLLKKRIGSYLQVLSDQAVWDMLLLLLLSLLITTYILVLLIILLCVLIILDHMYVAILVAFHYQNIT